MSPTKILPYAILLRAASPLLAQGPEATCIPDSVASLAYLVSLRIVREVGPFVDFRDTSLVQRHAIRIPTSNGARILATLSWGGPDRGLVFLLACDRHLLDADVPGYALSVSLRDVNADGVPDPVLNHETGTGTGWKQEATTVYLVVADTLMRAWSAATFEGNYQGPNMGGEWELRGTVSFPSPGVIELTTDSGAVHYDEARERFTFAGQPTHDIKRFKWKPAARTFQLSPQ